MLGPWFPCPCSDGTVHPRTGESGRLGGARSLSCTPSFPCGTLYNCPGHLAGIRGISLRDGASFPRIAGVAQSVEHLICNQRVGGSNPFASSRVEAVCGRERSGSPQPKSRAFCARELKLLARFRKSISKRNRFFQRTPFRTFPACSDLRGGLGATLVPCFAKVEPFSGRESER